MLRRLVDVREDNLVSEKHVGVIAPYMVYQPVSTRTLTFFDTTEKHRSPNRLLPARYRC